MNRIMNKMEENYPTTNANDIIKLKNKHHYYHFDKDIQQYSLYNSPEDFYQCFSLKALVWRKYRGTINTQIPSFLNNSLNSELIAYEFVNRRKYRKSVNKFWHITNKYPDLNNIFYRYLRPNHLYILLDNLPTMKDSLSKNLDIHFNQCIAYNNYGLFDDIFRMNYGKSLDIFKENYNKYLITSAANGLIDMFKFLYELCKKNELEVNKDKFTLKYKKRSESLNNALYSGIIIFDRKIMKMTKENKVISSVIFNDDVKFLEYLNKIGFDIANGAIEELCKNVCKYKCLSYILNLQDKKADLRQNKLEYTDKYYTYQDDYYEGDLLREQMMETLTADNND